MIINSKNEYLSKLAQKMETNRVLWFFSLFHIATTTILVIGYFRLQNNLYVSVELPPKILIEGKMEVSNTRANEVYFELWFKYLDKEFFSFKPEEFEKKHEKFELMFDPYIYYKYKGEFDGFKNTIITNLITQYFETEKMDISMETDGSSAKCIYHGFSTQLVGADEISTKKPCNYEIGLKLDKGHIYVDHYKTDCF